jgi:signal transduction histidine kinase
VAEGWGQVILQSISDGVILAGPDWRIREINVAAQGLLAVRREELLGRALGRDYCPVGPREIAAFRGVMRTRRGRSLRDVRLRGGEGSGRVFDAQVDACSDGGVVVVFRDVTERARLEQSAWAAAESAEAANRAKSEFLATMSHELRTPLNAIIGYIELLEVQLAGPLTDQQRSYLERIRSSSRHLLGIINDVLDLSRIDAGRLTVRQDVGRVRDVLEAALTLLRPEAAQRGLSLAVSCDESLTYAGDEDRVRQILANLLSNAVKFTEPGGRIAVTCGASRAPQSQGEGISPAPQVYVSIEDTGIGISDEQLAAIFDPFVQAETGRTRSRGGTGLGLTISRRLARLMGGEISAQSQPGRGSTFTLWLPATREAEGAAATPALPVEPHRYPAGLGPIGEMLGRRVQDAVQAYVRRLRELPIMPQARSLSDTDLEDHAASFLADVVQTLEILEHTGGEPADIFRDGSDLQQLIAERHGALRYHLGWTESALSREFDIMYDELSKAVHETPPHNADVRGAMKVLRGLLDRAQLVSVRGFRHAAGEDSA